MRPTGLNSLDEYNIQEIANGDQPESGLWSILIAPSADVAADFAERYVHVFDEIAMGDWHLIVGVNEANEERRRWKANFEFQKSIDEFRNQLKINKDVLNKLCIVFFDPYLQDPHEGCVVVPLDAKRIGDVAYYRQGFIRLHHAIRKSYDECALDPYHKLPSRLTADLLEALERNTRKKGLQPALCEIGSMLAHAVLGAIVSSAIGRSL
ncbi:hypothetical protein V6767_21960 [Martelella sp. FLE1502]